MEFNTERPMNGNSQRYSLSSYSSELGTGEMNSDKISVTADGKNTREEFPEQKGLQRRNTAIPGPSLMLEPFTGDLSKAPFSNMAPLSSDSWSSDESSSSPFRIRGASESINDFPSPIQRTSNQMNLSGSAGGGTPRYGNVDDYLLELTPCELEMIQCTSPSLSSPNLCCTSHLSSIEDCLDSLEKPGKGDRNLLSCDCLGNSNVPETSSPQLAFSDEVILPLPFAKSEDSACFGTRNVGRREWHRKKEKNLVNSPIQAEIRAKILGNKLALLDDENPQRELIIQDQLDSFCKKVMEGTHNAIKRTPSSEQ